MDLSVKTTTYGGPQLGHLDSIKETWQLYAGARCEDGQTWRGVILVGEHATTAKEVHALDETYPSPELARRAAGDRIRARVGALFA